MNEEKKTRRRRFQLTRGQRTVRNLVLFLVLAVLVWGIYGCPLPVKAAFRRLEREHMLESGEITLLLQAERGEDSAHVSLGGKTYNSFHTLCASVSPDWVICASSYTRSFDQWETVFCCSRGDGVDVIPLAYHQILDTNIVSGMPKLDYYMPYLVLDLDLPAEAARVEMDMAYRMINTDGEVDVDTTGLGEMQESGAWLFFLNRPSGHVAMNGQIGAPWTIRAYAADGTLLQELEGTVREYAVI